METFTQEMIFRGNSFEEIRRQIFEAAVSMGLRPVGAIDAGTGEVTLSPAQLGDRAKGVVRQESRPPRPNRPLKVAQPVDAGPPTKERLQLAIQGVFDARAPMKDGFTYCQDLLVKLGGWNTSDAVPEPEYGRVIEAFEERLAELQAAGE